MDMPRMALAIKQQYLSCRPIRAKKHPLDLAGETQKVILFVGYARTAVKLAAIVSKVYSRLDCRRTSWFSIEDGLVSKA